MPLLECIITFHSIMKEEKLYLLCREKLGFIVVLKNIKISIRQYFFLMWIYTWEYRSILFIAENLA